MNLPPRLVTFWRALKPWLVCRLSQPSTYAGLLIKAAAIAGFVVTDSVAGQVAEVLAAIAGAALVAYDQKAARP